jgi:D-hydroxyproline dehydrogenase subunit alpha
MPEPRRVDVAVIGAGPAGLAAATSAAAGGARVVVVDQSHHLGGQIWRHRDRARLKPGARRVLERFERSGAEHVAATAVVAAVPGALTLAGPRGSWELAARTIVLATGARELLLPFPGWTLPNVFGVGGAQALIKGGLPVRGRRVVVAGTGPLLFPVAATMAAGGARVAAVCEQAPARRLAAFGWSLWRAPGKLVSAAGYRWRFRGTRFRAGTWVERADGDGRVEAVTLTDGARRWTVACDLLATSSGLIPNVEVGVVIGCALTHGALAVDERQQTSVAGVFAAGECTGVAGERAALVEGIVAGRAAVGLDVSGWMPRLRRERAFGRRLDAAFAPRRELSARAAPETIVCRCEDVRLADMQQAWGARQAKLATRVGMGACQGRVCGAALQYLWGWEAPAVRPPVFPVPARDLIAPPEAG